jgi:RHS repeat-associated protein
MLEERLSSGQTYDYVQGPGVDRPLGMMDQASVVSYYLADHLGNVVQTTNSAGAVTLTREYDPWGNAIQGSTTGGYAFTGRDWDPETGLYYYRARYYDPKLGRFISEDPIGLTGGLDLYTYAANDVTSTIDPFGLAPQWPQCTEGPPMPGRIYTGKTFTRKVWERTGQKAQIRLPNPSNPYMGQGVGAQVCICYWKLVGVQRVTEMWQDFEITVTCKTDPRCWESTYSYIRKIKKKFGERVEDIPHYIIEPYGSSTTTTGKTGCDSCPDPST